MGQFVCIEDVVGIGVVIGQYEFLLLLYILNRFLLCFYGSDYFYIVFDLLCCVGFGKNIIFWFDVWYKLYEFVGVIEFLCVYFKVVFVLDNGCQQLLVEIVFGCFLFYDIVKRRKLFFMDGVDFGWKCGFVGNWVEVFVFQLDEMFF